MLLNGHSNFDLQTVQNKKGIFVLKTASNCEDIKRLHYQRIKQTEFHNYIQNNDLRYFIEIIPVISTRSNGFIMPFFNGKSIIDIIEKENIFLIEDIIDKLLRFIEWEIGLCDFKKLPIIEIKDKIKNIEKKCCDDDITNIVLHLNKKINLLEKKCIPIGICHGDFTFANMLFSNKIGLIDFLDSFIETPLWDIGKLLQELRLKWSYLMCKEKVDKTKIQIAYAYMNKILDKKIKEFELMYNIDDEILTIFYAITLLRILPYCKNKKVYNSIKKEISCLKY